MYHPPPGSPTNLESLSRQMFRGKNLKCPDGTAIWRIHFLRPRWGIDKTRGDVEEMVRLSHSGANPNGEVVRPIVVMPIRRHRILRELIFQDFSDCCDVLNE